MIATAERLLRANVDEAPRPATCVLLAVAGSAVFGLLLGGASGEPWLAVFAMLKLPLLLLFTTALCVPSFFVVHSVLGLRDDFGAAMAGLWSAQATLGITLAALAPFVAFATLSIGNEFTLTLADALLLGVGTIAAQQMLARHYKPLIARDARHRITLRGWLVLYAFTGVQLAWVLRPFRGTAGLPVQFLRPEAFEQNAYVVLFEHVARAFR
jgi:hypothetical protein